MTKELVYTEIVLHYACGHCCTYEGEYTFHASTMTFQPEPKECPHCGTEMTGEDFNA